METLTISSKNKKEVIDITPQVEGVLQNLGVKDGVCHLFLTHTTAALTTADLDPGAEEDILDALKELIPKLPYRHPHNPAHMPDHILSAIIGTSLTVPVKDGQLILGTWQRVVLIELDGPRERQIVVNFQLLN